MTVLHSLFFNWSATLNSTFCLLCQISNSEIGPLKTSGLKRNYNNFHFIPIYGKCIINSNIYRSMETIFTKKVITVQISNLL